MDGWMDGWVGGWVDGWMNEWMNESMNGWMGEWMNGWMDEWMNGWMNERTIWWCHPPLNRWKLGGWTNPLDMRKVRGLFKRSCWTSQKHCFLNVVILCFLKICSFSCMSTITKPPLDFIWSPNLSNMLYYFRGLGVVHSKVRRPCF